MKFKLEELEYQREAIQSVIGVFDGNSKNTFDNSTDEAFRFNLLTLTLEQIQENIKDIVAENGIDESKAQLSDEKDLCV